MSADETNATGLAGAVLFHGTIRERLPSIMAQGLRPHTLSWWDEDVRYVCLTDSLEQARANAWKHGRGESFKEMQARGVILAVDVAGLPLLVLGYVTCFQTIAPERITVYGEPPWGRLRKGRLPVEWREKEEG